MNDSAQTGKSTDEVRANLEHLLGSLESRRQEAYERAKQGYAQDWRLDYFYRGVIKTYDDLIVDLRQLLSSGDDEALPVPDAPIQYLLVDQEEIETMLNRVGVYTRAITLHPDGAITAVFSRVQPTPQEERIARLKSADPRIVILDTGKLGDTGEPFIDFALTTE